MMRKYIPWLVLLYSCTSSSVPPLPPAAVTATKPIVRDTVLYTNYIGHVRAYRSVALQSRIAGTLFARHFEKGQTVKQGDLLFEIDPRLYQIALEKARAQLTQNLAELQYAKDAVDRYAKLVKEDYIAQLDYEKHVTHALAVEAAVAQNRADIANAELNLNYCAIRAPFDGITGEVQIDVGNYVPVGATTPLTIINQITPIFIDFSVPEQDLPKIRSLQAQGALCVKVFAPQELTGALTLIDNQINTNTGTVLLEATFANESCTLWPGQFIDVQLQLDCKPSALLLPCQAIQMGQNGPYVFVIKADRTVEIRNIDVGQRQGDLCIVESGLMPDEEIVLEGQLSLYPGAKVQITTSQP